MSLIERLTPEQERQLVQWHEDWLRIGSCTERADRPRGERAIAGMYSRIGETAPHFIWVDSPATGCLMIAMLGEQTNRRVASSLGSSLGSSLETSLRSSLETSLGSSLVSSLGSSLGSSLWSSLRSSLGSSLRSSLRSSLETSLRSSLETSLGSSLVSSLWSSLRSSLGSSLRSSLGSSLGSSLESSLETSLGSSLRSSLVSSLGSSLWSSLRSSLVSSLGSSLGSSLWSSLYGQTTASWVGFYAFCRDVVGVRYEAQASSDLDLWIDVAQSCDWWWPYKGLCIVSERPEIVRWEAGRKPTRLHCDDGPALKYRDGWAVYCLHGVRVKPDDIEQPLTAARIREEPNAEVRRVLVDRYGPKRYLEDVGAKLIHAGYSAYDKSPVELYRVELPDDEPIVMLKVLNSTPEPDGSIKPYYLRVAPTHTDVHEARASTFRHPRTGERMTAKDFRPAVET